VRVDLDVVRKDLADGGARVRKGRPADRPALQARGGPVPAFVAAPGSTQEAAAVMRAAASHGLAVVPRGGGSRFSWGVPASRCDLVVDLSRMDSVLEHSHGDLIARVQSGARIADVQAALAQAGQEIALDVPGEATVGGIVASGLAGPRRLRYGTPRDLLIGVTIVRADGIVARSGGKVVKNVAGYDLGKLFAGSWGTLGLIAEANFRLHPLPAARAYVTAEYVAVSVACDAVAAAANSQLVASAVELSRGGPGGPIRVAVLLEGSVDGVAARASRMADLLGDGSVADAAPDWWPGCPHAAPGETLIRVSFWTSALTRVLDAVDAAADATGLAPVVHGSAGAGVLYVLVGSGASGAPAGSTAQSAASTGASTAVDTEKRGAGPGRSGVAAVAGFVAAVRAAVAGRRGGVAVLAAPAAVRAELAARSATGRSGAHVPGGPDEWDGMHGEVPGMALMRAVKDQFDPEHRMSPGRFPEGA
jgi:glycolate oxidase FAD binding subunit